MPAQLDSPVFPNGDPEALFWWTGVLGSAVPIPAALTRGLAIIINPLVRMPWDFPGGMPAWATDPQLFNGTMPGGATSIVPKMARESRFDFWSRWIRDAILHGIGVFSFDPDSEGQPLAGTLVRHNPRDLRPDVAATNAHDDWLLTWNGVQYHVDEFGRLTDYPGRRVVHFMRGHQGGVIGQHYTELLAAGKITEYAAQVFDSAVPSGVLESDMPLTQTQADTARTAWEASQYRRRIAVLGNGVKYRQVLMSPVDAAIGDMMLWTSTQIAHLLELPAYMLDGQSGTSMTYANINDQRQDFVDGTLAAWSARVEESLSALLTWGNGMTIDFTDYRKPSTAAVADVSDQPEGGMSDDPDSA